MVRIGFSKALETFGKYQKAFIEYSKNFEDFLWDILETFKNF